MWRILGGRIVDIHALHPRVRKSWTFLLFAAGDLAGAILLLTAFKMNWFGGGLVLVGIAFFLSLAAFVMALLGVRGLLKFQETSL
jgi:hypothetical protein